MNSKEKAVYVSLPVLAYLLYLVFLSCSDIIALGAYYMGYSRFNALEGAFAVIGTAFLFVIFRKNIVIERYKMDFMAYFSIILIVIIGLVRSICPDMAWDVKAARGFWQLPGFQDNVNYNVFPAAFTFFFPLGDRINYYPRLIFGYRLGTMIQAALIILCFLETRLLLRELVGEDLFLIQEKLKRKCDREVHYAIIFFFYNESSLALLANMLIYLIADLGTYMADLGAIPILLYLLRGAIKRNNDNSAIQFSFYALLCGFVFAIKFTIIILMAPILILYLIRNRKEIKMGHFFICLVIGCLPSVPYLLYAYTSTGNPVYWTFNSIFKSPYYPYKNFKDVRWGPQGIVDALLWPFRMIFNPEERVTEVSKWPQIYLLLGLVSALGILWRAIRKKITEYRMVGLAIVYLSMYFLWLFSTGYLRYAAICEIIAVVLFVVISSNILKSDEKKSHVLVYVSLICLVIQSTFNCATGLNYMYGWSSGGNTYSNIKNGKFAKNVRWLLRDRGQLGTEEQHEKVDVFLAMSNDRFFMQLFDENIPVINATYIMNKNHMASAQEDTGIDWESYYKESVKDMDDAGQSIYDLSSLYNMTEICENANRWGAEIVDLEHVDHYFSDYYVPVLVRYDIAEKTNTYVNIDHVLVEKNSDGKDFLDLHGIIYSTPQALNESQIQIIVTDGEESIVEAEVVLQPGEIYNLNQNSLVAAVDSKKDVEIMVVDGNPNIYGINLYLE